MQNPCKSKGEEKLRWTTILLRVVSRVNVSADKPVCILLRFIYTITETWRRLKIF